MCENEHHTSRLSKVIVWQIYIHTYRQTDKQTDRETDTTKTIAHAASLVAKIFVSSLAERAGYTSWRWCGSCGAARISAAAAAAAAVSANSVIGSWRMTDRSAAGISEGSVVSQRELAIGRQPTTGRVVVCCRCQGTAPSIERYRSYLYVMLAFSDGDRNTPITICFCMIFLPLEEFSCLSDFFVFLSAQSISSMDRL